MHRFIWACSSQVTISNAHYQLKDHCLCAQIKFLATFDCNNDYFSVESLHYDIQTMQVIEANHPLKLSSTIEMAMKTMETPQITRQKGDLINSGLWNMGNLKKILNLRHTWVKCVIHEAEVTCKFLGSFLGLDFVLYFPHGWGVGRSQRYCKTGSTLDWVGASTCIPIQLQKSV